MSDMLIYNVVKLKFVKSNFFKWFFSKYDIVIILLIILIFSVFFLVIIFYWFDEGVKND